MQSHHDNLFPYDGSLWQRMSINASGEETATTSRFASNLLPFDGTIGKKFGRIAYESPNGYRITYMYLYDVNGVFIKRIELDLPIVDEVRYCTLNSKDIPESATHYRLLIAPYPDRSVEEDEKNNLGIYATLSPSKIDLCTFNVGHYNKGGGAPVGADPSDSMILSEWLNAMDEIDSDIIACQETYEWFYNNDTSNAYETLWKNIYPFRSANDWVYNCHYGLDVFSKYRVLKTGIIDVTEPTDASATADGYDRHCTETCLLIDGKKVWLYNVHLHNGTLAADATARGSQMNEVLTAAKRKPRWIICGDFNAQDVAEYAPFVNYGPGLANLASGGIWGTKLTWPETYTRTPLDNIITSANIKINRVRVLSDVTVSDHLPLKASLTIF